MQIKNQRAVGVLEGGKWKGKEVPSKVASSVGGEPWGLRRQRQNRMHVMRPGATLGADFYPSIHSHHSLSSTASTLFLVNAMLRSSLGAGKGRLPVLRQPVSGRWLNSRSSVLGWNQFRRNASTVTSLESYPNVGQSLHGFTVQEKKHVPELHLTAVRLKHDKTDADYLHVARDDKNNVFGVGFKTNPPDATGVPHILEHTTLCGSEK